MSSARLNEADITAVVKYLKKGAFYLKPPETLLFLHRTKASAGDSCGSHHAVGVDFGD